MQDALSVEAALDSLHIGSLRKTVAAGDAASHVAELIVLGRVRHVDLQVVADVLHVDVLWLEVVGFEADFKVVFVVENLEEVVSKRLGFRRSLP